MTYIDERRRQRSVVWSKERNQIDQAGNQKKYRSHHRPKASDGGDDKSKRGEDKKIQPIKLICLLLMAIPTVRAAVPGRLMVYFVNTTSLLLLGCVAVVGLALWGLVTGGGAKDQALCVEIHCFCCEDIVLVSVAESHHLIALKHLLYLKFEIRLALKGFGLIAA